MKYLHINLMFFMQAFSFVSQAQMENPKFGHLTTSDGLSQSTVTSILKDHEGFMWFATSGGLNKYDGYKFTIYKHDPEKPSSLSDNSVSHIIQDNAGNLWVGTSSGIDKFDRGKDEFIHYKPGTGAVTDIFEDSRKRIWAGTSDGLYLMNAINGTFKSYKHTINDTNSLSDNSVYQVTEDNYGQIWIATKNGLNRLNRELQFFTCYKNNPHNRGSIGANWIRAVYKDTKGNIWAGTLGSGIALYDYEKNLFVNYRHDVNNNSISLNDILSFCEDGKGNLWIGTENGGISIFNYIAKTFITYKNDPYNSYSLSNNSIYSLFRDDLENIWVGTYSEGINFLPANGEKFTHYVQILSNNNSLNNNNILAMAGDSDGNLWLGTDGGGLNKFDKNAKKFTHFVNNANKENSINSNYVLSVIEVDKNLLALGLLRGGLDLFDTKTGRFSHHLPVKNNLKNSLSLSTVTILGKSHDGNVWVGTWGGGLNFFDRKKNSFTHYENDPNDSSSISGNFISCILEDREGNVWVGSGDGLDKLNKATGAFIHYRHSDINKKSLNQTNVQCIYEDHANNLWIGTRGGLNLFDKKNETFTAYTEKDGLVNNLIKSIMEDRQSNLWLASGGGLTKFDPVKKTFRNYSISDGLQGKEFKPNSCFLAADGQMFFGGSNGFNSFNPESLKDNNFIPPVYITGFQVFNKQVTPGDKGGPLQTQISEAKEITLSYKQSVFSFEFAALNYTLPEKNQYSYKLENFDKEWNYSGDKRTATYTNLDPGIYTFKVKASNNDAIWNNAGRSIKIIITPPFWLTWSFRALVVLCIAGSVFAFDRYRLITHNKQKINLQYQVQKQTRQLIRSTEEEQKARREAEQANVDLERKNREIEQFAYIVSHDLQEPLRTTSSFVALLQKQYRGKFDEKADKYFAFISDASHRMKMLINNLLDLSKIGVKKELEQVDCDKILQNVIADLGIIIQEAVATIKFDPLPVVSGYATELKQLFQNLITNAIKFRKKGIAPEIYISVQKDNCNWRFAFSDNGIGIEERYFEKIFAIFQRLHTQTEYEGSGIGLSHCKKIVELHKGKIWVESTPGEGSTFYFTIHT